MTLALLATSHSPLLEHAELDAEVSAELEAAFDEARRFVREFDPTAAPAQPEQIPAAPLDATSTDQPLAAGTSALNNRSRTVSRCRSASSIRVSCSGAAGSAYTSLMRRGRSAR